MEEQSVEDAIIDMYLPFIESDAHQISTAKFQSPTFDQVVSLCNKSKLQMMDKYKECTCTMEHPVTIIGDIHGNMKDLLLIFRNFGLPSDRKYLFIGDYVDRGMYSTPVISLLLALYLKYPNNLTLIKGNHEVSKINGEYGFLNELKAIYGESQGYTLWLQFNNVFAYLPLCCIISKIIFCVHGGLSPLLRTLDDLRSVTMPIRDVDKQSPIINDILWSDPSDTSGFKRNNRGQGFLFGYDKVHDFLTNNHFKLLVRGHQCTNTGVTLFSSNMGITVFSSSNYCRLLENKCGVFCMESKTDFTLHSLTFNGDTVSDYSTNMKCYPKRIGLIRAMNQNSRTPMTGARSPTVPLITGTTPQIGSNKTPRIIHTKPLGQTIAQNKARMMRMNEHQQNQLTMAQQNDLQLQISVQNQQQQIKAFNSKTIPKNSQKSPQKITVSQITETKETNQSQIKIHKSDETFQSQKECFSMKPQTPVIESNRSAREETENLNMTKGKILDIFTANREETQNTPEINEENLIPVAGEQERNCENTIQSSEKESENQHQETTQNPINENENNERKEENLPQKLPKSLMFIPFTDSDSDDGKTSSRRKIRRARSKIPVFKRYYHELLFV